MKLTACFVFLAAIAAAQSAFKPCAWVSGPNALGQLVVMCAPLDATTYKGDKGDTGPPGPAGKDGKDGKDGAPGKDAVVPPMGVACPVNPPSPVMVVRFSDGTCGVVTVVAPATTTASAVFVVRPGGALEDFSKGR